MMTIRSRKNFLPTVLFSLVAWSTVFFMIFFVDPQIVRDVPISGSYIPFFLLLFFSLFLTASLLLSHTRRGFLFALGIVVYLYLRLFGLGHLLNTVLLFAFLLVFELAVARSSWVIFMSRGKSPFVFLPYFLFCSWLTRFVSTCYKNLSLPN